jgi:hypothetical protein
MGVPTPGDSFYLRAVSDPATFAIAEHVYLYTAPGGSQVLLAFPAPAFLASTIKRLKDEAGAILFFSDARRLTGERTTAASVLRFFVVVGVAVLVDVI